jgi:hypothetical protein
MVLILTCLLDRPSYTQIFRLAVMRKTQRGTRLLGSIEIGQGEALFYGEQQKRAFTLYAGNPNLKLKYSLSCSTA